MAKVTTLEWGAFMRGEVEDKRRNYAVAIRSAAGSFVMMAPKIAYAAGGDSWVKIFATVLEIADWACLGVIIFAGATWMFQGRTKAMEMLISGGCGYLIIRHAMDIRNWLRGL